MWEYRLYKPIKISVYSLKLLVNNDIIIESYDSGFDNIVLCFDHNLGAETISVHRQVVVFF